MADLYFIRPEYNVLLGGELKPIHKSAANKWLLEEAQWFNVNTDIASIALKNVYKNYKKYIENSRKQTQFLKTNFSQNHMTTVLKSYLDQVKPVASVPLQLPKLKKKTTSPELPKLKLPKLKKA